MARVWIPALLILLGISTLSTATAQARNSGVLGNWANPSGSIIQIYRCGSDICAKLIFISASAPTHFDTENPDPALRGRSLCGLKIGTGFELAGPDRAQGGRLYDPKSGKIYSGSMTREGDKLKLRGYVGISLFGRTETWTRAPDSVATCHP